MKSSAKNKYDQLYKSIGFERSGLFKLIKEEFDPKTVIYPGCSIHITPSFYFNHVLYIDKSEQSMDFFENEDEVTDLINKNKTYTQQAYWKFMPKDFQSDLEIEDNRFDLLLSLFSGKLIGYCERYVKPGGLVLTNTLFSDHDWIKQQPRFTPLALIRCGNFQYHIDYKTDVRGRKQSKLRQANKGLEYVDNATYFIYQKVGRGST